MSDEAIWEQREGEPELWFDRFERFRLSGPVRSLLSIYNAERAKEGREYARDIPGAWKTEAQRWFWRDRAAAWDAAEQQRRREQYDAEREEDHAARVTLLKLARSKLFQAVNVLDAKTMKPADVLQGIRIVVQELRAEYDDLPTQPIDVASLSDEELSAIATGARRR